MKFLVLVLAVFFTGTNGQGIANTVRDRFNEFTNGIRDPISTDGVSLNISIPGFEEQLGVAAGVGGIEVSGLSSIELEQFRYSVPRSRATFRVVIPGIKVEFNETFISIKLFGRDLSVRISGSIGIEELAFEGEVRVSVGLIGSAGIRDADLDLSIGDIKSDLKVEVLGRDISDRVNTLLGETIPDTLSNNREQVNSFLENLLTRLGADD